MTTDVPILCRTCVYWEPPKRATRSYGFAADEREPFGQCRRRAPTTTRTDAGLKSLWPMTAGDWWCGEHASVVRFEEKKEET